MQNINNFEKYKNYIIRTDKNIVEIVRYVREYYSKKYKATLVPFWKTVYDDLKDGRNGAKISAEYIRQCFFLESGDVNKLDKTEFNTDVTFLCNPGRGGFSDAFSFKDFDVIYNDCERSFDSDHDSDFGV